MRSNSHDQMEPSTSLLGSWVSPSGDHCASDDVPNCIWHVVDDRTCVYEQRTEMGLLVSWFQYWADAGGILRYPLGESTRSMFRPAQHVPITVEADHLLVNGHRFERVRGLPIPERCDLMPGTRPDKNGNPTPHTFKSKLQEYLTHPPRGEGTPASHGDEPSA